VAHDNYCSINYFNDVNKNIKLNKIDEY